MLIVLNIPVWEKQKLRVHQVSAFMIQNQGEEMIWFFTQDITDVIKNRDEIA